MPRLPLVLLALIVITSSAHADMFKWTDTGGTVHYSRRPPSGKQPYSRFNMHETRQPRTARHKTDTGNPMTQATAADKNHKLCRLLKSNLDALQNSEQALIMKIDGKTQLLSVEQRKQQLGKTQNQYKHYCTP